MSWKAEYVFLIMISTLVDYSVARFLGKTTHKLKRKILLIFSLSANLGLLFAFKYFNFVSVSISESLRFFSIPFSPLMLKVMLPVGISFYTFQTIGYTIDVYRRKIKPAKHLGIFAVYVAFFPQLVAGPIERAGNLLPQFFKKHKFEYQQAVDGLKLILWGFFLKIVIADRLGILVDQVFNNVMNYNGFPLMLATMFFSFQIYCDFAGYSFIAIGAAQMMGFRLMDNFRRPYFSKSVSEFWKRWHISLSSWFKDYLYIPLGGNRVKVKRWYFNLMIVFLISGLWHGANWTFLAWGGLHGFYILFAIITKNTRNKLAEKFKLIKFPKIHKLFKIFITFILINLAWIVFRSNSIKDAFYIFTHLLSNFTFNLSGINLGLTWDGLIIAFASIFFMEFVHLIQERKGMRHFLSQRSLIVRWTIYLIILLAILLFGVFESRAFIYFQF
jgi:D-alanyl-lipoteichoic acid acyltransferase DltB (MBOAT superfamily)